MLAYVQQGNARHLCRRVRHDTLYLSPCFHLNCQVCMPAGTYMKEANFNANSAFLPCSCVIEGKSSGPLKGLTFAAKDLYDVRPIALTPV